MKNYFIFGFIGKKINNLSEVKPNLSSLNERSGVNYSEFNLKKKPGKNLFFDEIPIPKKLEVIKNFEPLPVPSIDINKKKKVLQRKYSFEKNEEGVIKDDLDLTLSPQKKKKGSFLMKNDNLEGNLSENEFKPKQISKKLQKNPLQVANQKEDEQKEDPISIYPFYQDTSVVIPDLLIVSNSSAVATVEGKKNYISIWNSFDKSLIHNIIFSSARSVVKFMVFSADGEHFGAFDQKQEIKIFDSVAKNIKSKINHTEEITAINFSNDNCFLIVADKKNNLSFYDIASQKLSKTFNMFGLQQPNLNFVVVITPLKDNESILLGTDDGKLMLFREKKANQILEQAIQIFDIIVFSGTHNEKIKFLSVSNDSNFCIVGSDSIIRFWNLETKYTKDFIDTSENKENTIIKVKFTSISLSGHTKKIAAGNSRGDIIIWNFANPEIPLYILSGTHLAPIYSVEFADNNNNVISKSIDCIKKWKLFKEPNVIDFSQVMCFSSDCKFEILSESEQKLYLKFKENQRKLLINLPVSNSKLKMEENEVSPVQEIEMQQVKEPLLTLEPQHIQIVEDLDVKFRFLNTKQSFVLATKKSKPLIYLYEFQEDMNDLSCKDEPLIISQIDELIEIKISPNDNNILLIGKTLMEIWKKKDKEKEEYVAILPSITMESNIIQIEFLESKLIILDENRVVLFIDLSDGRKGSGGLEKIRINYICPLKNHFYILTETFIQYINFHSVDYMSQRESFPVENVKSFLISKMNNNKLVYQNLNNDICVCLSGLDFKYTYVLKSNQKDVTYYLNENDDLVVVSKDKKLRFYNNPFKNEKFLLNNSRHFSFFYDVLNNNKKKNLNSNEEKEFFDIGCGIKGVILPFYQTFFHKIAFIRDEDAFEKFCSKINSEINLDAFFKKDINGMSCLEILFQQKNNTFVTKIILYWVNHYKIDTLFKKYKENFYEYINFEICNKLIHLFKEDTQLLNTLFTFLFQSPLKTTISLPKLDNDFLLVIDDPEITVDVVKELLSSKLKEENSLEYALVKVLYVANATEREYKMNREFLNELTTLDPTNLIFSNEALINLINCKWSAYGWKYFFFEFTFYLFYCVIYILQSSYILPERVINKDNHDHIVVSYVFDIFCLVYLFYNICHEIYQIFKLGFVSYINSFWNIVDVILFYLSFAAIILDLVNLSKNDYYLEQLKLLYSISMFFCFLRLLSYARGIKGSAFMIRLILQVFIDIKYFVALIIIFIIGLAISGILFCNYRCKLIYRV